MEIHISRTRTITINDRPNIVCQVTIFEKVIIVSSSSSLQTGQSPLISMPICLGRSSRIDFRTKNLTFRH